MMVSISSWRKAVNILFSQGPRALLVQTNKALAARTQNRAFRQIDKISESDMPISQKFSIIYQKKLWLKGMPHFNRDKTLSGHGSTVESTAVLRQNLQAFLRDKPAITFFDAPCGDFNWMKIFNFPDDCTYIGGDVVPELISSLQRQYGRAASRQFIKFDLTSDEFPDADMWFCKDCFQHLSNTDINLALNNFRRSRIRIALISNHSGVSENIDIRTGQFRHVGLTLPPFNLPKPGQILSDSPSDGEPRFVGVWYRKSLT
jgi:hypothetical protein